MCRRHASKGMAFDGKLTFKFRESACLCPACWSGISRRLVKQPCSLTFGWMARPYMLLPQEMSGYPSPRVLTSVAKQSQAIETSIFSKHAFTERLAGRIHQPSPEINSQQLHGPCTVIKFTMSLPGIKLGTKQSSAMLGNCQETIHYQPCLVFP